MDIEYQRIEKLLQSSMVGDRLMGIEYLFSYLQKKYATGRNIYRIYDDQTRIEITTPSANDWWDVKIIGFVNEFLQSLKDIKEIAAWIDWPEFRKDEPGSTYILPIKIGHK